MKPRGSGSWPPASAARRNVSLAAIVSADTKGRIFVFNRAAARIFGYEPGHVLNRVNVEQLYPPGVARDVMRKIRSADYGGPTGSRIISSRSRATHKLVSFAGTASQRRLSPTLKPSLLLNSVSWVCRCDEISHVRKLGNSDK